MKLDFVIKNGHVVDPAQGIDQKMDIAVKDNRIRAHYADQRCRHSAMTFPSSLRTVRNLSLSRGLVNV